MEENQTSSPLFKKLDQFIFEKIDAFRTNPGYNVIQDFYNNLDEEQQKVFKGIVILAIFVIPLMFLGVLAWQNSNLKDDLNLRLSIVNKAKEIKAQRSQLGEVTPRMISTSPIEDQSGLTSRLSNLLSSSGVDTSKIQVNNFESTNISGTIVRSEADVAFTNYSTNDLMNIFSSLIQREKFKISSVNILKNPDTGLLNGQFHAIHFSLKNLNEGQEE